MSNDGTILGLLMLKKVSNIVFDVGIQLSLGRLLLYWSGGGLPQTLTLIALVVGVTARIYTEIIGKDHPILNKHSALNVGTIALGGICINSFAQGDTLAFISSLLFAFGNISLANYFDGIERRLSYIFERVFSKIIIQPQTLYTAALGVAAYMATGDSTIYFLGIGHVHTPLITFIPTAIGGGLSIRNVINNYNKIKSKPFFWMAGGIGVTSLAGMVYGEMLPALAHAVFSIAYMKMQINDIKESKITNNQ